jgi:hypothetical protein
MRLEALEAEFTTNPLISQEYLGTRSGKNKISNVSFHSVPVAS